MRSVLSVHCSGFSWRDLHKFVTIFKMPAPLEDMPPQYLNKIEDVVKSAVEESMQGAAVRSTKQITLHIHQFPTALTSQ